MKGKECLIILLVVIFIGVNFTLCEKRVLAEEILDEVEVNTESEEVATFYVGGEGASDSNDGMSSTTPFETLYRASLAANSIVEGDTVILVQGDTTETMTSVIGRYGNHEGKITIKNLTNNVYTINRGSNLDAMIYVNTYNRLILGNQAGSDTINLIFDGNYNNTEVGAPIIESYGYVDLYNGVSLRNNKCNGDYGSAVYSNYNLNMYGGEICNNSGLKYGAVYSNSFNMYGGKIYNNHTSANGGGVYSFGSFELYDGTISSNTCGGLGAGVYNCSYTFIMHGGVVNDNVALLDAGGVYTESGFAMDNGAIIANETTKGKTGGVYMQKYPVGHGGKSIITGGSISGNNGIGLNVGESSSIEITGGNINGNDIGVNAESGSRVTITGGSINNNKISGVSTANDLNIGSDTLIYENGNIPTDIMLTSTYAKIFLRSALSRTINVIPYNYMKGERILHGSQIDLTESYKKLVFPDSQYTLNGAGCIIPKEELLTYYVDQENGFDFNDGLSSTSPFSTLKAAAFAIDDGNGTIIVQSDLTLYQPVITNGNITIKGDGNLHTIKRAATFNPYQADNENIWSMIIVCGNLTLGDEDATKLTESLMFDAYLSKYTTYIDGRADTVYIEVGAECNMYKGVTLQNNNRAAAIINKGNFNMYEGIISNNEGDYAGGVYNCQNANFLMSGGSIEHNRSNGGSINGQMYGSGGVFNKDNCTFTMIGGSISYNDGYNFGGVYNGVNCTFHMTGGRIELQYGEIRDLRCGVFNDSGSNFIIENSPIIKAVNSVYMVEGSKITVNSKLVATDPILTIIPVKQDAVTKRYEANYIPGMQLITSGAGYTFGENEIINNFSISSNDFQLDKNGMVLKIIRKIWMSKPEGVYYTYTGSEITPTVTIIDGTTILQQGIDYTVTCSDNVTAGTKIFTITGKGNYVGTCTLDYTIYPAIATSVITDITSKFYSASNGYSKAQLYDSLCNSVEVQFDGGRATLGVDWYLTGGTFDYLGGNYTFTGTIKGNSNIKDGGLTLKTHITVIPVVAKVISFSDISVPIGSNNSATANDLGQSILPISGSYLQEGAYELGYPNSGVITYTIDWDNKTLNTTDNRSVTIFTGKMNYINYPKWLTIPSNLTVERKVGVTGKRNVNIQFSVTSKTYDGTVVDTKVAINEQGYDGTYLYAYFNKLNNEYLGNIAPKNAGTYKCIISIPNEDVNFTGSKEVDFQIKQREIILQVDNKTILLNDPLPTFTYQFVKGKELLGNDTLITEPIITAVGAKTDVVSKYIISAQGATANENYNITYRTGILSVTAPSGGIGGGGIGGGGSGGGGVSDSENKDETEKTEWNDISLEISKQLSSINNSDFPAMLNIVMDSTNTLPNTIIDQIKGKSINLNIELKNGVTWIINGNSITNTTIGDIDLGVDLNSNIISAKIIDKMVESKENLQIGLKFNGSFGFAATVVLPVNKKMAGQIATLYYYNPTLGIFEYRSANIVDIDGNVALTFNHASDYLIVFDNNIYISDDLLNEISINTKKDTLYLGGTTGTNMELTINLPDELRETITNGKTAYTVTYSSSKNSVATISRTGIITAKGIGKTTIITTVKIGGTSTNFTTEITVKKAYLKFVTFNASMKIGQKSNFTIEAQGYNLKNISWYTTRKNIVFVGKNSGKLTAKVTATSKGTDYLVVRLTDDDGNIIIKKIKIDVN